MLASIVLQKQTMFANAIVAMARPHLVSVSMLAIHVLRCTARRSVRLAGDVTGRLNASPAEGVKLATYIRGVDSAIIAMKA